MHPVNKLFSLFGLQLSKTNTTAKQINEKETEFRAKYEKYYKEVENNTRGFIPYKDYRYQAGEHPKDARDVQFEFAAYHLYQAKPAAILDIGSYRHFIQGLLAYHNVTTIDIRDRKSILPSENVLTCDAKDLKLPGESFDAVITLGSIYIFGLGRYGDDFDMNADIKAIDEMIRVLKPGGLLIFSSSIHAAKPTILFNRCRIYDYDMIRKFCDGLECVDEQFYSKQFNRVCSQAELTSEHKLFDLYLGCWRKR